MGLSVNKLSLAQPKGHIGKVVSFGKTIRFKDTSINGDKTPSEDYVYLPKEGAVPVFGQYDMTTTQIRQNNIMASNAVHTVSECMKSKLKDYKPKKYEFGVSSTRVDEETIDKLVDPAIALLAYYQFDPVTYPEFADTVKRGFPRACYLEDKRNSNDNCVRLCKKVITKIEDYGKSVEPDAEDPYDIGVRYLYFSNDLPHIKAPCENNYLGFLSRYYTREQIEKCGTTAAIVRMQERGIPPEMTNEMAIIYPRCHLSPIPNEIAVWGTDAIRKKCCDGKGNIWGHKLNLNYVEHQKIELDKQRNLKPPCETPPEKWWTIWDLLPPP